MYDRRQEDGVMGDEDDRFPAWLKMTMERRGFSQADLARAIGVTDTQISRWRRGQVVPTVHSLQRLADTFGVPRASLDHLAGYPVDEPPEGVDPALQAELQAHRAWYGQVLEQQVPRDLWRTYIEGCAALAKALSSSYQTTVQKARDELEAHQPGAGAEFHPVRPVQPHDRSKAKGKIGFNR